MWSFVFRASKHHYTQLNRIEGSGRFSAIVQTFQLALIWLLSFSLVVSLSFVAGMRFAGYNGFDNIGCNRSPVS